MQSKILLVMMTALILPQSIYAKKPPEPQVRDSVQEAMYMDSVRKVRLDEVHFIIDNIENTYISGRRGMDDTEWNKRKDYVNKEVARFLKDFNGYYLYELRYLGMLTDDAHFKFPDDGQLNRCGAFTKDDLIFPLWVQTWTDGTVYNVKDYSGQIPQYARILSVNGTPAEPMARMNRIIAPGENIYAMANMNAKYETEPQLWPNFANFLFTEGIHPPFEVVYTAQGSEQADTVILNGMRRQDKLNQFRNSGDRHSSKQERGFPRKPVVYTNAGDSIGVLAINSLWGKRWSHMLLFGKDWRYKRLLRSAMRKIDRQEIKDLVIDVSLNSGGMSENVYYTLDYLTDKPVDIIQKYLITDTNRKQAMMNIENSPFIAEADREYLTGYIDTLPSGTLFCTDTVRTMQHVPGNPKHKFKGNIYILTGHQTYSAAQIFARHCQALGIPIAGQHCGGYNDVTGNVSKVDLPSTRWVDFMIPFSAQTVCKDDAPYNYPTVDIPIDHPFDEWLKRENHSLDRLLEIIRAEKNWKEEITN